jgi:putative ABC transport system permease protein
MDTLLPDLRYAVRLLIKKPAFTVIVVAALALGIGANTAIFSVVNSILLRPLPYRDPSRLVMIWMNNKRMNVDEDIHSYPNYVDYRDQNQVFESMAAYSGVSLNLVGAAEPERVIGAAATASLFEVLGVEPQMGRVFTAEEEQIGRDKVVVLSYGLWRRRFGKDPNILGQNIQVSDVSRTVIGVMPPSFKYPHKDAEIWVPLAVDENRRAARGSFAYYAIGRLKPGVSIDQARAEMGSLASNFERQYPAILEGLGVNLVPLHQQVTSRVRPALLVLLGTVAIVLLIACANVANLLLARAAGREREIAIRTALGASRVRLIRQLLTESSLMALAGGTAGLLIAKWGLSVLIALSPEDIPRLDQIGIDGRVLGFTLLVSLVTGLLFGLVPALQASKPDLNESLKESGRSATAGVERRRVRSALVVLEVALSLVLLIGAGLMIKSFSRLQKVDLGFNPDRLVSMNIQLSRTKYEGPKAAAFFRQLIDRVGAMPGVESAGAISAIFIDALPNSTNFTVEGKPPFPTAEQIETPVDLVTPTYFRTMGIALLKGREFTEQDGLETQPVAMINDTFARRFWPGEDPIGRRFKFGDSGSDTPWMTIVGVVGDMRRTGLDVDVRCETFLPYTQRRFVGFLSLVVRAKSDPGTIATAVRDLVWSLDPNQPVSHIRTMDQLLEGMMAQRRLNMVLFALFGGVALVLAAVGVYGVISYSVTQRTHEIGIRMALGADRADVLRLIVLNGMMLVIVGVAIGLLAAAALTRLMTALLFGVSATDPITFVAVSGILLGVALAACFVPALKAIRVDPMIALRYE